MSTMIILWVAFVLGALYGVFHLLSWWRQDTFIRNSIVRLMKDEAQKKANKFNGATRKYTKEFCNLCGFRLQLIEYKINYYDDQSGQPLTYYATMGCSNRFSHPSGQVNRVYSMNIDYRLVHFPQGNLENNELE